MSGVILPGLRELSHMIVQFAYFIIDPQFKFVEVVNPRIFQSLFEDADAFHLVSALPTTFRQTE